tara:strand:+ start:412 stop:843 length:432 start_codon:yes stop_codon:yes gene_type:complete
MTDIAQELTRSGGASAKWDAIGDVRRITITDEPEKRQARKFGTDEPDTWPNGDPLWEYVFSGTDPDTGEETRFFCKDNAQLPAVKEAMRAAGVTKGHDFTGGTLAIKLAGKQPSKTKGFADKNVWSAQYKPAVTNAVTDDLIP